MKYPCTGHVTADGFGAYLEASLTTPRANLHAFAADLSAMFEVPFVTLVNSGSSANLAAACALRERVKGKRALVSAFTFPTTVSALQWAGFEPYFVDTEGFQIDPAAVDRAMNADVGVVAITHFLGFPSPVPRAPAILQDACETMAMRIGGRPIAELADVTTFSFYHPHHLSSYGGGAVVTHDGDLARIIESVGHWGRACTHQLPDDRLPCPAPTGPDHFFHYIRSGFNLEMSELNACFGRWSLQHFADDELRRAQHYSVLRTAVGDGAVTYAAPDVGVTPAVFPITVHGDDARPTIDRLLARGVEARSCMGGVIADHPAFVHLPHDGLVRARALARRSFFVGIHQALPDVAGMARIVAGEVR
jgi:dTDP-4-amino-4,6-dideoxygalactose transaminase